MKIFKPPHEVPYAVLKSYKSIFLAGSIENGTASDWQKTAEKLFSNSDVNILNPRRDDWNTNIKSTIEDPAFVEQVMWELTGVEHCAYVLMNFDPQTNSPISLLELGILAGIKSTKTHVICPPGFWRKGNVDVVCKKYGIIMHITLEDAVSAIKKDIERVYYE